jgi:hypothetical protein
VRKGIAVLGLSVAIAFASHPAQAGDRKSSRRDQNSSEEIVLTRPERSVSTKHEMSGSSSSRNLEIASSGSSGIRFKRNGATPTEDAPRREHQRLTLFHIDSSFGKIEVAPIVGKVNGAQFSIGF